MSSMASFISQRKKSVARPPEELSFVTCSLCLEMRLLQTPNMKSTCMPSLVFGKYQLWPVLAVLNAENKTGL